MQELFGPLSITDIHWEGFSEQGMGHCKVALNPEAGPYSHRTSYPIYFHVRLSQLIARRRSIMSDHKLSKKELNKDRYKVEPGERKDPGRTGSPKIGIG